MSRPKLAKTSKEERYKRRVRALQDRIDDLKEALHVVEQKNSIQWHRLQKYEQIWRELSGRCGFLVGRGVSGNSNILQGNEVEILPPFTSLQEVRDFVRTQKGL